MSNNDGEEGEKSMGKRKKKTLTDSPDLVSSFFSRLPKVLSQKLKYSVEKII